MLTMPEGLFAEMVAHCLAGLPDEACGLLGGDPQRGVVDRSYPMVNVAASAKLYSVDPAGHLRADRDAQGRGGEILGVYHSHTHTEAWPSPTDLAQAPDPGWHYLIVSLRDTHPVVRSFRIVDGRCDEEVLLLSPQSTEAAELGGPAA